MPSAPVQFTSINAPTVSRITAERIGFDCEGSNTRSVLLVALSGMDIDPEAEHLSTFGWTAALCKRHQFSSQIDCDRD
jgi:hypothetical protein